MEKLEQFQLYLLREGLAPATIEKDVVILKRLMQLEVLAGDKIDGFLLSQLQKGRAPGYLNNIVKACHTWGAFIEDPLFEKIKFFKPKESNKSTLSDAEIQAFLALPKPKQSKPERYAMWNLFFKIMAFSGMRAGEVANLSVTSLDFGRGVFILDKTKTTPRLVPIAPALSGDLISYIGKLSGELLFVIDGKTITKGKWGEHFQVRIRRLNIKRPHLSTHSLRHSFITRLLSEDINMFKVQRIVGHKNIETTNHYTHLITKDLQIAIGKDPLARQSLTYQERFMQFREGVRKLLESFTLSPEEEKQMLKDLSTYF
jgi:integrase